MKTYNLKYGLNKQEGVTEISLGELQVAKRILEEKYIFTRESQGEYPGETDNYFYHSIGKKGDVNLSVHLYDNFIWAWSENNNSLSDLLVGELNLPKSLLK